MRTCDVSYDTVPVSTLYPTEPRAQMLGSINVVSAHVIIVSVVITTKYLEVKTVKKYVSEEIV